MLTLIRTPIVAMTAKVLPGDREECLKTSMDGFLATPFKREQLPTLVKEFVEMEKTHYQKRRPTPVFIDLMT